MRAGALCGCLYAVLAFALFMIMIIGTNNNDFHKNAMKPMELNRNFTDPLRDWALDPIVDIGMAYKKPCSAYGKGWETMMHNYWNGTKAVACTDGSADCETAPK